ncbi:MAG TPA: MucR family transcriptional regulator [Geodermatophilus sp.]|nr:MucR family transcriptional regulator [Geodermatophilus sp.]
MLHPVGPLPAAVYWRRRLLVLALLVAVLGGGGWLAVAAATGGDGGASASAATSSAVSEAPAPPALERVVPSLASVQTPSAPASTEPAPPAPAPPPPAPGGPCGDDMIALEVRTPGTVPVGAKPTFDLVVTNVSPVPCARTLDKGLQEIVLLDAAGTRLWGSNDCFPEGSSDARMLAPGESVAFPLVWSGLTSEPTCTAPRTPLVPGQYVLRGRLDTKTSPDAVLTVA